MLPKEPEVLFRETKYELSAHVDEDTDTVVEVSIWQCGELVERFAPYEATTTLRRSALAAIEEFYGLVRVLEPI